MSDLCNPVYVFCPHCGERICIQLDALPDDEEFMEDCSVCCRPIVLHAVRDEDGDLSVSAKRDSD